MKSNDGQGREDGRAGKSLRDGCIRPTLRNAGAPATALFPDDLKTWRTVLRDV